MPWFPMYQEPIGDARVAELNLLAWADRFGRLEVANNPASSWRDLLISLVSDGLLTTFSYEREQQYWSSQGHGSAPGRVDGSGIAGESRLERSLVRCKLVALDQLGSGT